MIRLTARSLLALLVRPYLRAELPGWGRLFHFTVGDYRHDPNWASAGCAIIADKRYGLYRVLNLGHWSDRFVYFMGRWYDLCAQIAVDGLVEPGDTVIDAGANVGHFTMAAASRVGPSGQVFSFEPNPVVHARCLVHTTLNGLDQVRLRNAGLADEPGELTLSVPNINHGEATFGDTHYPDGRQVTCPVIRLDDVVPQNGVKLLKIDVEGFELRVLRGARAILQSSRPYILTEIIGRHLAACGESSETLVAELEAMNYRARRLVLRRLGFRHALFLIDSDPRRQDGDYLWVHAEKALNDELWAGNRPMLRV